MLTRGLAVDSPRYLQLLYSRCQSLGAIFRKQQIFSLRELESYSHIIVALGAEITDLPELSHLPVNRVKGQVLRMSWPESLPSLPLPITGSAYIVPGKEFIVGATYEKVPYATDSAFAEKELLPKLEEMIPGFPQSQILGVQSGLRATCPGHRPLIKQIDSKTWIFTGLGSKGLLYRRLVG